MVTYVNSAASNSGCGTMTTKDVTKMTEKFFKVAKCDYNGALLIALLVLAGSGAAGFRAFRVTIIYLLMTVSVILAGPERNRKCFHPTHNSS